MALHSQKVGLVKESLVEMLYVAEYAVTCRKTDKTKWGAYATGGILGFPATMILFSIIDCLGSIFANNKNFQVIIDGKKKSIKNPNQHIYILNSKYFDLDLSQVDLDNIYSNVRSTLTHNSLLPEGYLLQIGESENLPFNVAINESGRRIYFINVIKLYEFTKRATEKFIDDLDRGVIDFKSSIVHANVSKRDVPTSMYSSKPGQFEIPIREWIKK